MTNIFRKSLITAAAIAVSATGLSTAANAQSHSIRTTTVEYGDLDLTSVEGVQTFEGRIKGAVRKVCGGYDSRSLADMADHGKCTQEANMSAKRASVTIVAAAEAGTLQETAMVIGK